MAGRKNKASSAGCLIIIVVLFVMGVLANIIEAVSARPWILLIIVVVSIGVFLLRKHLTSVRKREKEAEELLNLAKLYADDVNKTVGVIAFFTSYACLIDTLEKLKFFEGKVKFHGTKPTDQTAQIQSNKPNIINEMLDRVINEINSKYTSESSRITAYENMLIEISIYQDEIPPETQQYINEFRHRVVAPYKKRVEAERIAEAKTLEIQRAHDEKIKKIRKQKIRNLALVSNGYEFEEYIANIMRLNGFTKVENTPKSGDYGIDVLAEKDGVRYAVQCKLYSTPVGPGAVQEASTGKAFYNVHVAIVATNSTFTSSAKEMADKVGVVLWDREKVLEMQPAPEIEIPSDMRTEQEGNDKMLRIGSDTEKASNSVDNHILSGAGLVFSLKELPSSVIESAMSGNELAVQLICALKLTGAIDELDGSNPISLLITHDMFLEEYSKLDKELIKSETQKFPIVTNEELKEQVESRIVYEHDDLLESAIEVAIEYGQISTSTLQRKLKLGYSRATKLIDMMEVRGMVGPFEGSKPRTVLLKKGQLADTTDEQVVSQNNRF